MAPFHFWRDTMEYTIGEVYDFDGQKRKVIGMNGPHPITTTDLSWEPEKPVPSAGNTDAIRAEIRAELEAEYQKAGDYAELLSLLPLDKCNKEELLSVAAYIGKEIPDVDAAKADIIAVILGA